MENNLQNKDSLLEKIKKENEEMHKNIKKMESEMANLEQANSKLKYEFSEKEKNSSHEKSILLDENRNLKKMFFFIFFTKIIIFTLKIEGKR